MKKVIPFISVNYSIFLYPLIISSGAFVFQDIYVMLFVFSLSLFIEVLIIKAVKFPPLSLSLQFLFTGLDLFYFYFVLASFQLLQFLVIVIGVLAVLLALYLINNNRVTLTFLALFLGTTYISGIMNSADSAGSIKKLEMSKIRAGRKRNIYFIGLDGLVSNAFFTKFYDTGYLVPKVLSEYGFSVNDIISPGTMTLETYTRLIAASKNIHPRLYKEIIANSNSSFYLELKALGYKKAFIYDNDYFGVDANNIFDVFIPKENTYCNFCTYIDDRWGFGFCKLYNKYARWGDTRTGYEKATDGLIKNISSVFKDTTGWFVINHIWFPGHSAQGYDCMDTAQNKAYRSYYINSQTETINIITTVSKYIRLHDPDPVIIFMGDHGSWLFRSAENIPENKISGQDLFLDKQSVLFAVYPKIIGDNITRRLTGNNSELLFEFILEESVRDSQ